MRFVDYSGENDLLSFVELKQYKQYFRKIRQLMMPRLQVASTSAEALPEYATEELRAHQYKATSGGLYSHDMEKSEGHTIASIVSKKKRSSMSKQEAYIANLLNKQDPTFGDRLMIFRYRAGLSQNKLSKLLGINAKTIGRWELGMCPPRENMLAQLVTIFLQYHALSPSDIPEFWNVAVTMAVYIPAYPPAKLMELFQLECSQKQGTAGYATNTKSSSEAHEWRNEAIVRDKKHRNRPLLA